jgi:hypothetical protein
VAVLWEIHCETDVLHAAVWGMVIKQALRHTVDWRIEIAGRPCYARAFPSSFQVPNLLEHCMGQGDKVSVMHVPYASLDSSTCKLRSNISFTFVQSVLSILIYILLQVGGLDLHTTCADSELL